MPRHGADAVVGVDLDQVADAAAFADPSALGDLEHAQPEALAAVGEEEQVVVVGAREQLLDVVLVARARSPAADAAAPLRPVLDQARALDQALMRDRDDDLLVVDHVLHDEVAAAVVVDDRPARIGEALAHVGQLGDDDRHALAARIENAFEASDLSHNLAVLGFDLGALQTRQA